MGQDSKIQWTHHTFSPWEGCAKVSDGCKNCYAETRNERFHQGKHWGVAAPRLMRSETYWREPQKWNRAAMDAGERHRVFCASLADVFEDRPDLVEPRARVFRLIGICDQLDWLLLTKRPENIRRLKPLDWLTTIPRNVWLGTTIEDDDQIVERGQWLGWQQARIRFFSCEPLLSAIGLEDWLLNTDSDERPNWIIVGSESGPGARPMKIEWARSIVETCRAFRIPVFVKQIATPGDPKGSDMSRWPEDLRVRELPQ